ncbi:MAG: sulfotransferase family protein [Acidimicrobiales bacterium]
MTGRFPTCDALLAQASSEAGLADFGPGDFREGLGVLLQSLERDGDLSPEGAERVTADLRRRLVNRLEVEAWYRDRPEIEDLAIRGPVDINGLPRSGTTALANMLSIDPQFRCLRGWEQAKPCPPPTPAGEATDPRRLQALADQAQLSPELKAMHLYDVDATMEDTEVLGMAFHGQQYTLPVYGYHAWWRETDMVDTYAYHRRVVKLLQSQRPPELWLFKAPHHNFHLEAMVESYPDALFVVTHRDPVKAVPSWVSIVSAILPPSAGERDLHRLGREAAEHLRVGVERGITARHRLGEEHFFDVHHRAFVSDPWGTVERIYGFLGLDLRPGVEGAFRVWLRTNRTGAHGTHRYTAEQFGLTDAQLRRDFAFYTDHFDIELET